MPKEPKARTRKCIRCRKDKARCEPLPRSFPRRCERCIKYDYPCSENLTIQEERLFKGKPSRIPALSKPSRLHSDAECLQEMGDLTSLLDAIRVMKPMQKLHQWPFSAQYGIKLRSKLEDAVHESIKRAQQHELDGCWREAEYLWRAIGMYATTDRPRNIKNARMETKLNSQKYSNRTMGLSNLVALHEKLGDLPQAEHTQEMLIARVAYSTEDNNKQQTPECWIDSLIRLYAKFKDRVADLEVDNFEKGTLMELASLSLLLRVMALECKELFVSLLNSHSSMVPASEVGPTLLHLSASRGSLMFTTLLLSAGNEVDYLDRSGRTALHLAAKEGHTNVVRTLLQSRADVNWRDDDGYSPFHFACMDGYTEIVQIMLGFSADVKTRTFEDQFSPLLLAVRSGEETLVKLLLESGSDLAEHTSIGKTGLHFAAEAGHEALVKLILDRGIGPDSADTYGIRPLHDAANAEIAQLLIDRGADTQSPDKFCETPLLSAAWRADPKVVETLLAFSVDINVRDDQERTPLHRAVFQSRHEIVGILLDQGADVNAKDCDMKTPLHYAATSGDIDIVRELLRHGAKPQLLDSEGNSALVCAAAPRIEEDSMPAQETFESISTLLLEAWEQELQKGVA